MRQRERSHALPVTVYVEFDNGRSQIRRSRCRTVPGVGLFVHHLCRYISNGANKQYLSFKVLPFELFVATTGGLR
jgi:hypothetical protein